MYIAVDMGDVDILATRITVPGGVTSDKDNSQDDIKWRKRYFKNSVLLNTLCLWNK